MADFIKGTQQRTLLFGNQVVRSATLQPATGTGTLFTVTGGAILVTSLFGLVTVATPATANTLALGTAPTVGTAATAVIATAESTASLQAGTWIGIQAASVVAGTPDVYTLGKLAVSGASGAGNVMFETADFTVSAGTITWTTTGTAATGTIAWYLSYVPLDTGASVA